MNSAVRPLEGIKVVELSHMVLGPSCGLILADLGADVVKVEPAPEGDKTRQLPGSGSGYFGAFNRNKRSVAVDLKSTEGHKFAMKLVSGSDVLIENFGAGVLDRLGLGYDAMQKINPRLVYCALKGFLSGPYEHRAAAALATQPPDTLCYPGAAFEIAELLLRRLHRDAQLFISRSWARDGRRSPADAEEQRSAA